MVLPGDRVPLENTGPDPQWAYESEGSPRRASGLLERRAEQRAGRRSRVTEALRRVYEAFGDAAEAPETEPGTRATEVDAGPAVVDTSGAERRALPRRDSACSVQICVVPGGEPAQGQRIEWLLHAARQCGPLVDVSLRSVSLMLGAPLPSGERVILRLVNRRLDKEVDRTAQVVRSVAGSSEWRVVCRFDEPLTLEELQHFARFPFGSACV